MPEWVEIDQIPFDNMPLDDLEWYYSQYCGLKQLGFEFLGQCVLL